MAQDRYASIQFPVSDSGNVVRGGGIFVSNDFDLNDSGTWNGIVIDPGGDVLTEDYSGITAWLNGVNLFQLELDGSFFFGDKTGNRVQYYSDSNYILINIVDNAGGLMVGAESEVTGFVMNTDGFFAYAETQQLHAWILAESIEWQGIAAGRGDSFWGDYAGGAGLWFDKSEGICHAALDLSVETYVKLPADTKLYLSLSMGEAAGTKVLDSSRSKYNFTFNASGTPTWNATSLRSGSTCLYFVGDTTSDFIASDSATTPDLDITSGAWAMSFILYTTGKTLGDTTTSFIYSRQLWGTSGMSVVINQTSRAIVVYSHDGSTHSHVSGVSIYSNSTVTHVVLNCDGTNLSFWIDGNQIGDSVAWTAPASCSAQTLIGGVASGSSQGFKGFLENFRVWKDVSLTESEIKAMFVNPSGNRGGRLIAHSVLVGSLPTSTGFMIDSTGFWAYFAGIQVGGTSLSINVPWQRTNDANVSPIDAGFVLDVGDEVMGGFNYTYPPTGEPYGGIFYDLSEKTLEIRAALVTSECRVPVGENFILYGTFEVHGDILVYDGQDLFFYDDSNPDQLIAGVGTGSFPGPSPASFWGLLVATSIDGTGAPYPLILGSGLAGSTAYNAGLIIIASPTSGSNRAILCPSVNTDGNYGVHIGDSNFRFRMGYFRGLDVSYGGGIWLGTSVSKFKLHVDGVGDYWAYITPT